MLTHLQILLLRLMSVPKQTFSKLAEGLLRKRKEEKSRVAL